MLIPGEVILGLTGAQIGALVYLARVISRTRERLARLEAIEEVRLAHGGGGKTRGHDHE